jgi:hypothetical protein
VAVAAICAVGRPHYQLTGGSSLSQPMTDNAGGIFAIWLAVAGKDKRTTRCAGIGSVPSTFSGKSEMDRADRRLRRQSMVSNYYPAFMRSN